MFSIFIKMNVYVLWILAATFYQVLDFSASINTNNVRKHLGTRTPYRFIVNKNDSRIKYPGKYVYAL